MLRRLIAVFFVLALAGQIYAGVCGCVGGKSELEHACCKPKTAVENSMQGKACCETICAMSQSENTVPDRLETLAKITLQVVEPESIVPTFEFSSVIDRKPLSQPSNFHDAEPLRPSALYLRLHAFRI